jgi:Domain of unknown function (DUF3644)
MPSGFTKEVRTQIAKAQAAVTAAVDVYNRPGGSFRTPHYLVLMVIGWTALFHAIFYKRGDKPWYRKEGRSAKGVRYVRIDGEIKHWELGECVKRFYSDQHPAERKNLEFTIGLRNRIEHRDLPELDPALYGECQALLMNFEDLISREFGSRYSLLDSLAVSLQFSKAMPAEREKAIRSLASSASKDVREYIAKFRANLKPDVLNSTSYSFSVFLVPKVANRASASDVAIEFVPYDPTNAVDMKNLEHVVALIREKQVHVANIDRFRPGQVVDLLKQRVPYRVNMETHTRAWRYFEIRPRAGSSNPERTKSQYCVYDKLHGDYGYTPAWVEKLVNELSNPAAFRRITGNAPEPVNA